MFGLNRLATTGNTIRNKDGIGDRLHHPRRRRVSSLVGGGVGQYHLRRRRALGGRTVGLVKTTMGRCASACRASIESNPDRP